MDNILRQKLKNLEVPFDAAHWEQMAQRLEKWPSEPTDIFDAAIASGLANTEANMTPDWAAFSEKLDVSEDDSMHPLDAIIAGNLSNLDTSTTPDWGDFSSILEEAEATDLTTDNNIIDQKTQRSLNQFETPYAPETWPKMNERIEETFSLRGRLMRYKVAEITFVLLLLFTVLNTISIAKIENWKLKSFFEKTEVKQTEAGPIAAIKRGMQNKASAKQHAQRKSSNIATDYFGHLSPVLNETSANSFSPFISNIIPSKPTILATKEAKIATNFASVLPIATINSTAETLTNSTQNSLLAYHNSDKNISNNKDEEAKKLNIRNWFPLNKLDKRKAKLDVIEKDGTDKLKSLINPLKTKAFRMGFHTGLNINKVLSPYDRAFNISPDTVYSAGYSSGLSFSFQHNRWHIESGGMYVSKRYDTNLPTETYGSFTTAYFQENFQGIQLDILQVPLTIQYDPIRTNKWRIYGLAGASANIVLNTAYQIKEVKLGGDDTATRGTIEDEKGRSNLTKKDFTEGVSEGGVLRDNIFTHATIGLGVERHLTQRWSIYLQPNYQYQFSQQGIGPNDNMFRTWSVYFGTRVNVFQK